MCGSRFSFSFLFQVLSPSTRLPVFAALKLCASIIFSITWVRHRDSSLPPRFLASGEAGINKAQLTTPFSHIWEHKLDWVFCSGSLSFSLSLSLSLQTVLSCTSLLKELLLRGSLFTSTPKMKLRSGTTTTTKPTSSSPASSRQKQAQLVIACEPLTGFTRSGLLFRREDRCDAKQNLAM